MRDPAPFDAGEPLFRRVLDRHIVGGVIAIDAVEMPACSFNRSKFSRPGDVIAGDDQRVAWIAADNLPEPIRREPPAKNYEFFVHDCPETDNEAHCEIRIRPEGEEFRDRVKSAVKQEARSRLVKRLALWQEAPKPPGVEGV